LSALVLALLFSATPAQALFGFSGSDSSGRTALVFAPESEQLDWDALEALVLKHPDASFTLALVPEDVPEEAHPWLKEWAAKEHCEVALRIKGDPLLPLIARHDPGQAVTRVALARVAYRTLFGEYPAGLVPGGGLVTPDQGLLLERQSFLWAAVGESEFLSPWYADKSLVMMPFRIPLSTDSKDLAPKGIKALMLSEADGPLMPGEGLARLSRLLENRESDFTSVSAGLRAFSTYAVGPEEWLGFAGGSDSFTDTPLQRKAWRLYHSAARALARYQDSGSARLSTLNKAAVALHKAQTHWFYRADKLRDPDIDKAFRNHLKRLHRYIGLRLPKELWRPMTHGLADEPESLDEAEVLAQTRGRVIRSYGDQALGFKNPAESSAAALKSPPELAPGTTAHHLWTPESMQVRWDNDSVSFSFSMKALHLDPETPNGFLDLGIELYMDLNRLAGRGATSLLPARRGFLADQDAWEFVLVVNGWQGGLLRSVPGQAPVSAGAVPVELDEKSGTIQVTVPRRRLRGNPAAWSYLFVTTGVDEAGGNATPPKPLMGDNGSSLLGMLGTLEDQARLAKDDYSYRRFTALRPEEEAPSAPRH
jgi:hypothetical protein